jgi:hypothetical protein
MNFSMMNKQMNTKGRGAGMLPVYLRNRLLSRGLLVVRISLCDWVCLVVPRN